MRASSAALSRAATARLRSRRAGKSTAMTRASMSAVTPGSVAPRTPASLARLRAWVCDSDFVVGAMKASAAARAAATGAGGSAPWFGRSAITARVASAPACAATSRSASPELAARRIGDHEHLLPARTARQSATTAFRALFRAESEGAGRMDER